MTTTSLLRLRPAASNTVASATSATSATATRMAFARRPASALPFRRPATLGRLYCASSAAAPKCRSARSPLTSHMAPAPLRGAQPLLRFYSSEPPSPPDPDRRSSADDASNKDAQPSPSGASKQQQPQKQPPLAPGWVHLTEQELENFDKMLAIMPPSRRQELGEIIDGLRRYGAPAELRDLIRKANREGLSLGDGMKAFKIVFNMTKHMAEMRGREEEMRGQDAEQSGGVSGSPDSSNATPPGKKQHGGGLFGLGGRQPFNQNAAPGADQQQPNPNQAENQNQFANQPGGDGKQPPHGPEGGEGGKKKDDDKKGGPFKKPDTSDWMTWAVAAALLYPLLQLILPGAQTSEITWQEMRRNFLDKGLVDKLTVTGSRVVVELNREATQATYPDSAAANPQQRYYFSIGSVDAFERRLEEAQDELDIPPSERIPVSYASEGMMANLLLGFGPTILLVGILYYMTRRGPGGVGGSSGIFGYGKSKAKRFNHESAVKVKFADVAGMDEAKVEIMEFVSFLKQPERFQRLGAKIPRGAILAGPPGTGKTLLAKATAGESGVPFFSVSGSEFVEMFVGVGASRVRDLFATARRNAPCIVFIDEIDAIGRSRGEGRFSSGGNEEREATLNQILTEMDGFNTTEQVVVLAGTNRPDILDKALMRPGRFDRHINIDRPTMKGRQEIFRVYLAKIVTKEDVDYLVGRLAALTPGFAGADIANAVNEAALVAARANAETVEMKHFEQAIERVVGGLERKSLVLNPQEKKTVAYHEAGHAICGWYFQYADPLLKVSIIPRGQGALGYAQYLPVGDAYLMSVQQLMDRMAMTLGGRVSEEIHFPTVTTGASDDFKKVTRMATTMVTEWGMSEKLGPLHFRQDDQNQFQKPFAEATAQTIDAEVRRIVDDAYKQCRNLLTARKHEVGLVAEELLRKEVLVRDDLVRLLGPRPFPDQDEFSKYFNNDGGSGVGGDKAPPFPPEETDTDMGGGDNNAPAPALFKQR